MTLDLSMQPRMDSPNFHWHTLSMKRERLSEFGVYENTHLVDLWPVHCSTMNFFLYEAENGPYKTYRQYRRIILTDWIADDKLCWDHWNIGRIFEDIPKQEVLWNRRKDKSRWAKRVRLQIPSHSRKLLPCGRNGVFVFGFLPSSHAQGAPRGGGWVKEWSE